MIYSQRSRFGALGWLCQCVSGVFLALFVARQDYARLALVNITGTGMLDAFNVGADFAMAVCVHLHCLSDGGVCSHPFVVGIVVAAVAGRMGGSPGAASDVAGKSAAHRQMAGGSRRAAALFQGRPTAICSVHSCNRKMSATMSIAQRLEEAIYIGVLKIGEILFPFFSSLQGEGDKRVGDLFFRAAWVLNVLAVGVLGALIPVAGNVLHLWTGAEVAAEGQRVLIVLAVAGILGSGTNVFAFYLLANGRTRTNAAISLVTASVYLGRVPWRCLISDGPRPAGVPALARWPRWW